MAEVVVRSCTRANASERRSGLVAFLQIQYGELALDSVTLRRTRDSRYVLSFPQRRDQAGRAHAYVKPISDVARIEVERRVLAQLNVAQLDAPEEAADA
jgi:hypothetical protein